MKFVSIKAKPATKIPKRTTHLDPNLSTTYPVTGVSNPLSNRPMLAAADVTARLMPGSEAIDLNNADMAI